MIDVEERLRDALRVAGEAKQREVEVAPRSFASSPQLPHRSWSRRALAAAIVVLLLAAGVAVRASLRDERNGLSSRLSLWFLPTYLPDGFEFRSAWVFDHPNQAQDVHANVRVYGRVGADGSVIEGVGVATLWNGGPSPTWSGARDVVSVPVDGCGGVSLRGVGLSPQAIEEVKATLWCNHIDGVPFGDIVPPSSFELLASADLQQQSVLYASVNYYGQADERISVTLQSSWPDPIAEDWFSGLTRSSEVSGARTLSISESRVAVGPSAYTASFVADGVRVSVIGSGGVARDAVVRVADGIASVSEREFRLRAADTRFVNSTSPMRLVVPATVPDGYRLEKVTDDVLRMVTDNGHSSVTLQATMSTSVSIGGGFSDERLIDVNGKRVVLYTWRLPNPPQGFDAQPATRAEKYADRVYVNAIGYNVSDELIARIVAEAIPVDEAGFKEFLRRNGLE